MSPLLVLVGIERIFSNIKRFYSIDDGKLRNIFFAPMNTERGVRKEKYHLLPSLTLLNP